MARRHQVVRHKKAGGLPGLLALAGAVRAACEHEGQMLCDRGKNEVELSHASIAHFMLVETAFKAVSCGTGLTELNKSKLGVRRRTKQART